VSSSYEVGRKEGRKRRKSWDREDREDREDDAARLEEDSAALEAVGVERAMYERG